MTEVKRFSGRTYGKSEDSTASRAFDEIFAKPKPTAVKWGNASYSKSRIEHEPDTKKMKLETEEPSDPFSFEFDADRSPKKRTIFKASPAAAPSRKVVMQPAVRITANTPGGRGKVKSELDEDIGGELTVKRATRIYTKGAGRKIKEEQEVTQLKMDMDVKTEKKTVQELHSTGSSQGSSGQTSETTDSQENSDDADEGFYIEEEDGSSYEVKDPSFIIPSEDDNIFLRPKREPQSPMKNTEGEEITVRFRSQYLNPEVYSKFTENVRPKDPIGRLSNSKVVHKNVLKHDSGTTLIVVCSPKVGDEEIKQSNTQTKYFKDNMKDIAKSKNKTPAALAKQRGRNKSPEKDPYELDDDNFDPPQSSGDSETNVANSPIVVSSETENSQPDTVPVRRSTRSNPVPEPKKVNVDAIVKSAKAAPPRKYHRIFRSRNKGYMQPSEENPEPEPEQTEEKEESSEDKQTSEVEESSPMETEESTEAVISESDSQSKEEAPTEEGTPTSEDQSQEMTQESDLESSQQSVVSDGQGAEADVSSQEIQSEPSLKKAKSVKAPPAERKIFRARGSKSSVTKKIFSSPKKAAAVYNVRSWQDEDEIPGVVTSNGENEDTPQAPGGPPKLKPAIKKAKNREVPQEMPKLTRAVHWQGNHGDDAYTSVHVPKEHKELFTVVKNVKEAHECQEFGETQEFDDDIDYLLAGIKSSEPMPTRCLSCIGLAQKCTMPAFRMHLRAHGTVTKIFGCLQDAAGDPSLALCTSALMFMLSRDRLNMDLDQESLNLMLRLLGVDQQEDLATTLSPTATRALNRNKDRVLEVYQEFLKQSGTKDAIDLDCLSTGNLAMESLLSLTSRRAGEWFKEELRSLGALDHIVDTVCSCTEAIGDDIRVLTNSSLENLKKTDRCLRVLENVTYLNLDNQNYLINYKDSCLVTSLSKSLKMCQSCLSIYPLAESLSTGKVDKESFGWVLYSCILAVLRVLLNLTHDNDTGCVKIGDQPSVMETVLLCILQSPQYVPIDLRFDLFVLSLGLLINLVEHSDNNRAKLLGMQTLPMYENPNQEKTMLAFLSLVEVFTHREEAARQLEEADEPKTPEPSPNKSGEWRESDSGMEWVVDSAKKSSQKSTGSKNGEDDNGKDLDDEETFTKALHKAGKHMENSIVAAYVALLVGCMIQGNKECGDQVKEHLPEKNFSGMIYMLRKFLGFMNLTSGVGSAGGKSIERVIEVLEKC